MTADGSELLALALSFSAEEISDLEAVESLVDASGCSATSLMSACSYAQAMARDKPLDPTSERTIALLTRAVQRAISLSCEQPSASEHPALLEQIVETAGEEALAPGAVEARTAELDAALDQLRGDAGAQPAS